MSKDTISVKSFNLNNKSMVRVKYSLSIKARKYFQILAKNQNYTSEYFAISLTNLSYAIAELEKEVSNKLFLSHAENENLVIKLAFIDSSIGMMIKVPVHQQASALLIVINENRPKRAIYLATVKNRPLMPVA